MTSTLNRKQKRSIGGFKLERRTYRLEFEDHDLLGGAVVRARSVPLGKLMEIMDLAKIGLDGQPNLTPEDMDNINKLWELFSDCIIEWDLEDDEGPIPVSVEGLNRMDIEVVMVLMMNWMKAVMNVPDPLSQTSTAGGQSVGQSIPMEPLSANQAS